MLTKAVASVLGIDEHDVNLKTYQETSDNNLDVKYIITAHKKYLDLDYITTELKKEDFTKVLQKNLDGGYIMVSTTDVQKSDGSDDKTTPKPSFRSTFMPSEKPKHISATKNSEYEVSQILICASKKVTNHSTLKKGISKAVGDILNVPARDVTLLSMEELKDNTVKVRFKIVDENDRIVDADKLTSKLMKLSYMKVLQEIFHGYVKVDDTYTVQTGKATKV